MMYRPWRADVWLGPTLALPHLTKAAQLLLDQRKVMHVNLSLRVPYSKSGERWFKREILGVVCKSFQKQLFYRSLTVIYPRKRYNVRR